MELLGVKCWAPLTGSLRRPEWESNSKLTYWDYVLAALEGATVNQFCVTLVWGTTYALLLNPLDLRIHPEYTAK